MNTRGPLRKKILAMALTTLFCLGSSGAVFAEIIGDPSKLDAFLRQLNANIPNGIDVVAGKASDFSFRDDNASRPRIAYLSGMPAEPGTEARADWMDHFLSGATGLVGAIKPAGKSGMPAKASASSDEFFRKWEQAAMEKRVFLSFTSEDAEHAHAVAKSLNALGFVTFVFLKEGEKDPPYDPDFVGKKFTEAGLHLVLDSKNARKSLGVRLEADLARMIEEYRKSAPSPELGDFLRQLDLVKEDWTLTENPDRPGRLFFHRTLRDGKLEDLAYIVDVEKDGSWSVRRPVASEKGAGPGNRIGSIKNPPPVNIGICTCCK